MALCYRDQTYCMSDCTNDMCFRYASKQTKQDAREFGLPMAWADFSKNCEGYTNDSQ